MSDLGELREDLERGKVLHLSNYGRNLHADDEAGSASKGECDPLLMSEIRDARYRRTEKRIWALIWIMAALAFTLVYATSRADPLCWPYSATATRVYSSVNLKGFAVAWFCDISHQWHRTGFAGHWSDLKPNWTTQPAAQPFAPQATLKTAWDANITGTLEDPASPDHDMLDLYLSTGVPESYPPSGLVTQDTKVYKQRQGVGTAAWVQIGTVALGVPCDQTLRVEPYFSVPRSAVKLTSRFDSLPLITFAKCQ